MGMGIAYLEYLSEKGHFAKPGCRILDVGAQNLYNATIESIRSLVQKHGRITDDAEFCIAAHNLSYYSTPRPNERTAYISELLDLTDLQYMAYDICPAPRTNILDLNHTQLPERLHGTFDVVLNMGTTEHVFNQLNSYQFIHDAMATGGIAFHQLPSIGWINHGYFTYHKVFFDGIINANNYEVLDLWYNPAGRTDIDFANMDVRDPEKPLQPYGATSPEQPRSVANYNLNVVVRKRHAAPFALGYELTGAHANMSESINPVFVPQQARAPSADNQRQLQRLEEEMEARARERDAAIIERDEIQRQLQRLEEEKEARTRERDAAITERDEARREVGALHNSRSWRLTAPLRALSGRRSNADAWS
jgi:hypothetical protein